MCLYEKILYDRIIIGGGASGMSAAVFSARSGANVLILEKNDILGKKIYATGNGRCNYTNINNNNSNYFSHDALFLNTLINTYDSKWTIEFFRGIGVEPYIERGRVYPYSEQAKSIVIALKNEINRLGINVVNNIKVLKVTNIDDSNVRKRFEIQTNDATYMCYDLIIATGLYSDIYVQNKCFGLNIAKQFGILYELPCPAICKLMVNDKYFPNLAGLRVRANVSLYIDDNFVICEYGQIQFNKDSISGIPVLQLSGEANRAISKYSNVKIKFDFAPGIDISKFIKYKMNFKAKYVFNGLLPDKLGLYIIRKMNIPENMIVYNINFDVLLHLCNFVHEFEVNISKMSDNKYAQAATGGILTSELGFDMQSRKVSGLYFIGELINIYGKCGGYNLQLAWASAAATMRNL